MAGHKVNITLTVKWNLALTILARFLRRIKRYSETSGTLVFVATLRASSMARPAFSFSQSMLHYISPSKLQGYLPGNSVILMLQCEFGFNSPCIGSRNSSSPLQTKLKAKLERCKLSEIEHLPDKLGFLEVEFELLSGVEVVEDDEAS